MGNLPTLKPREVSSLLAGLGFKEVRQRGSHRQYRHAEGWNDGSLSLRPRHLPHAAAEDCQGYRAHRGAVPRARVGACGPTMYLDSSCQSKTASLLLSVDSRVKKLEQENRRLERRLQKAEAIIAFQKKLPGFWGSP